MSPSPVFPRGGYLNLNSALAKLGHAPTALAINDAATIKTLAIEETPGGIVAPLLSVVRVLPTPTDRGGLIELAMGPFRVFGTDLTATSVQDEAGLNTQLQYWHGLVSSYSSALSFDTCFSRWYPSRNMWHQRPGWVLEISQSRSPYQWNLSLAEGPFLNPAGPWFARDFNDLVSTWIECPTFSQQSNSPLLYMVIPEGRGWLERISQDGRELIIDIAGSHLGHFCAILWSDYEDKTERHILQAQDTRTLRLDVPSAIRTLSVSLWTHQGELLDRFDETAQSSSWGTSVLRPGVRHPLAATLEMALGRGEGETIEFKSWVGPTASDAKAMELIATVVAFANAGGGTLYIGVSDSGEVVGTTRELFKWKGLPGAPEDKKRLAYLQQIVKLVTEGISPTPDVHYNWIEYAGLHVLQIEVQPGSHAPYGVVTTNAFLQRRGATNRTMSRAELELVFRTRA